MQTSHTQTKPKHLYICVNCISHINKMLEEKPYHLCFETLANELRIKIIELLGSRSMGVNELADSLGAERSRVSHSLNILKGCSIVDIKKVGKRMIYSLKDKTYLNAVKNGNSVLGIIDNHVDTFCDTCFKIKA